LSSNIVDFVRVGGDRNRKDINKILATLQDLNAAEPEDAALQERIVLSDGFRKRSTTVTSGAPNQIIANDRDRDGIHVIRIQPPLVVESYPLLHTVNGTFTFPAADTKFGARANFSGGECIICTDDAVLNPADAITVAFWGYFPASSGNKGVIVKGSFPNENYYWRLGSAADTVKCNVLVGGANRTISSIYTPNTWNHYAMTWDNITNQNDCYIDGTPLTPVATSGNMAVAAGDLGIGSKGDAGLKLPNGSRLAWVTILNQKMSSSWVTDHMNGLIDLSGGKLISMVPFVGDSSEQPDSTSNYCQSS